MCTCQTFGHYFSLNWMREMCLNLWQVMFMVFTLDNTPFFYLFTKWEYSVAKCTVCSLSYVLFKWNKSLTDAIALVEFKHCRCVSFPRRPGFEYAEQIELLYSLYEWRKFLPSLSNFPRLNWTNLQDQKGCWIQFSLSVINQSFFNLCEQLRTWLE